MNNSLRKIVVAFSFMAMTHVSITVDFDPDDIVLRVLKLSGSVARHLSGCHPKLQDEQPPVDNDASASDPTAFNSCTSHAKEAAPHASLRRRGLTNHMPR